VALVTGRPPGALRRPDTEVPAAQSIWIDAVMLLFILAMFAGLIALGRQWTKPLGNEVEIHLSLGALPWYTLLTLSRGFAGYFLSLVFTLVYGSAAAHSRYAEKLMVPLLDILQGIPVLAFIPTVVLALIGLFPHSNVGLELSCIVAIFTGQAWNMTFSYYGSVKAIPKELIEVARLHRFGIWKRFSALEVPSAMIGLVWNSMMSMAGGWFFLTVVEDFTLRDENFHVQHFRVPGVGAYMKEAYDQHNVGAMIAACVAMLLMITLVDQLFWRPLIAWSHRFKLEETEAAERPRSFVYDLVRRSRIGAWLRDQARARRMFRDRGAALEAAGGPETIGVREATERAEKVGKVVGALAALGIAVLAAAGGWHLFRMLATLDAHDWLHIAASLGVTLLRVIVVLAAGAAWTIPIGVWIGRSPRLSRRLQPVIQAVASFPVPMLFAPVAGALVASGLDFNVVANVLMLLGTQWYILFNVVAGAMAVPQDLREVAAVYGLRDVARFRFLYLPGIFPFLVTGLITAVGGAWNASIISEYIDRGETLAPLVAPGIGGLMEKAFVDGRYPLLAASVLALAALLVLLNRLIWKPLYRLADTKYALNR
jgi:NitT/TauT family transport system permease protein